MSSQENTPIRVEGVEIVNILQEKVERETLFMGDTLNLYASISPCDADNKEVIWKTNNMICSINENGRVEPNMVGGCEITVTTRDGLHEAKCLIDVVEKLQKPLPRIPSLNEIDGVNTYPDGSVGFDDIDITLFRDNIKQPTAFFVKDDLNLSKPGTEMSNSPVNTIWAEKADYLHGENVGEGLQNIAKFKLDANKQPVMNKDDMTAEMTYILSLKHAQKDQLGGIRLNGNFEPVYDKDNNIIDATIKINNYIATGPNPAVGEPQPGLVNPDESFEIEPDGTMHLNPATISQLGGVLIQETTDTGILVKNGDKITNKSALRITNTGMPYVYSDYLVNSLPNDVKNHANLNKLSNFDKKTLDGSFALLMEAYRQQLEKYNKVRDELEAYTESFVDNRSMIYGSNRFGSTTDGDVKYTNIKFDKLDRISNTDYVVIVKQTSITLADVGEITVKKRKDGFTVYTSGNNDWDTFDFLVIPYEKKDDGTFVDYISPDRFDPSDLNKDSFNDLPIARGHGKFMGIETVINKDLEDPMFVNKIRFVVPFNSLNFAVAVTPTLNGLSGDEMDGLGTVGDVWIRKFKIKNNLNQYEYGFYVYCSSNSNIMPTFDWIAVEYKTPERKEDKDGNYLGDIYTDYSYDKILFPVRAGNVVSVEGKTSVNFANSLFYDKRYIVLPQLSINKDPDKTNIDTDFGEYSVDISEKSRSGFSFHNSGQIIEEYSMDWIIIENVGRYPSADDMEALRDTMLGIEEKLDSIEYAFEQFTALDTRMRTIEERLQTIEDLLKK